MRPLVLATGHHHFNEVFFTDVEVPKTQLLGPINQGLEGLDHHPRVRAPPSGARNPIGQVLALIAVARRLPMDGGTAWDDPRIRQRLSQLYIDCEAMKYALPRAHPPDPWRGARAEGSILKLSGLSWACASRTRPASCSAARAGESRAPSSSSTRRAGLNRLVAARQYTISAGTSEIQRNILGERVLGLPKG